MKETIPPYSSETPEKKWEKVDNFINSSIEWFEEMDSRFNKDKDFERDLGANPIELARTAIFQILEKENKLEVLRKRMDAVHKVEKLYSKFLWPGMTANLERKPWDELDQKEKDFINDNFPIGAITRNPEAINVNKMEGEEDEKTKRIKRASATLHFLGDLGAILRTLEMDPYDIEKIPRERFAA